MAYDRLSAGLVSHPPSHNRNSYLRSDGRLMIFLLLGFLYLLFAGITIAWFTRQLENQYAVLDRGKMTRMYFVLVFFWWIFLPIALGEVVFRKVLK